MLKSDYGWLKKRNKTILKKIILDLKNWFIKHIKSRKRLSYGTRCIGFKSRLWVHESKSSYFNDIWIRITENKNCNHRKEDVQESRQCFHKENWMKLIWTQTNPMIF
jgi:hypothetical protein